MCDIAIDMYFQSVFQNFESKMAASFYSLNIKHFNT